MSRPRTLLTIGLLILCLAVTTTWIRSYWRADTLVWGGNDRPNRALSSVAGRVGFSVIYGTLWSDQFKWYSGRFAGPQPDPPYSIAGFHYARGTVTLKLHPGMAPMKTWAIQIPYWFPTLLAAVLPVWWLVRRWRNRRAFAVGHCEGCGYDLRATPDRCPECGRVTG